MTGIDRTTRPGARFTSTRVGRLMLLLVSLALVTGGIGATILPASAEPEESESSAPLLSDFGSCLAGGETGSIVLLIDQSGSLERTDPEKARVEAAEFLVKRLENFSAESGYPLEVRVAGFAAAYEPSGDWTTLSEGETGAVDSEIGSVGDDLRSHDTDYWNALEGARQDLADHGSSCSAIFWFSDGEYDIDPRESAGSRSEYGETKSYAPGIELGDEAGAGAAVAAGEEDICRSAGVADQLRGAEITVVGIGLTSEGADFSFLRSVTTGGGKDTAAQNDVAQCGDLASPEGAFFEADDLDSLLLAFDSLSSPGDSLGSTTLDICQGGSCAAGEVAFVLDRALTSVRILATVDVEGLEAYVVPPGASEPVSFPAGEVGETVSRDGMDVTWLTSKTVEIEMAADDVSTWDGTWRVGFVDPESVTDGEQVVVNLHLTSPLALAWQGIDDADFRQGASVEDTSLELVDRTDGSVVDPKELGGSVTAAVRLTDALQAEHELFTTDEPESLTDPPDLTVPEGVALGTGRVTTSLQITTAEPTLADGSTGEGMVLQPVLIGDSVTVLPPQNYPVVGSELDFGLLEEETAASAALEATGPGCVWVDSSATSVAGAPSEAGDIAIASDAMSAEDCLQVGEGETASLPLTLETGSHANGAVQGTVTVMVAPEGDPEAAQPVTVPFDADMRRPLDVTTAWTTFAVALVLGIGIPVAALYLLTWLTARVPRGTLVSGSTRVRIPDPGVPAQIGLSRRELTMSALSSPQRTVMAAGRTFRTRVAPFPSESPWVELADAAPSVSSATPGTRRGTSRLPLGMRGNWVAIPDRADPGWATLIVLLGSEDQEALDTVLDDARVRLGDRLRSLGGGVVAPAAGPGEDGGSAVLSDASGWGPAGGPAGSWGGVSDPPTSGPGWGDSGQTGGSSGWGPSGKTDWPGSDNGQQSR
ncbi:hypothetical protein [Brachybacterium alimentarium]|uniref:hypothetical protein n=1 Tax=Brachybacterium alimentarium TaxID=47845 RepID=UPI003FCF9EA2